MKLNLYILFFILFGFKIQAQTLTPFTWQYPKYGGHALNCTRWINAQKFIAVGDAGTINLSSDDGATWQRVQPFTIVDFKGIFVKDSLTLFIAGSLGNGKGEIYKTVDGGETWEIVYNNINMPLKDIHFPNDSVGYCVGKYSTIVKTIDGGVTWNDLTNVSNISGELNTVWFLNSDTGYVGRSSSFSMYKTSNGGLTWSQVFGYGGTGCYTIKFLNDTLGYAGAYNSRIYRTTNAGLSWAQQTTFQTNEEISAIDFSDITHGVAVTESYIYRTTNGTNWGGTTFLGGNKVSGAFSPTGTIIVGDTHGGIFKGANFATTYNNVNSQSGLQVFRRIKFVDAQNGWVGGDGYNILKTNNGGNTWTVTNPTTYIDYVNDITAISASKVIIAAGSSDGKVYMTTNGGTTYTSQTLSTTNRLTAISFPTATIGYVVGYNGIAFKTVNGGTSYTAISTGITSNITEVFFVTALYGFVVSEFGEIKKTVDGGLTWSTLSGSGMGTTIQIYFTDISNGYTVNGNGEVFRTTDGGNSFLSAGQTCLQTPFDMQFVNDSTGFVVGSFVNSFCDISYTTNYGSTWQSINLPYAYAGWGVHAFDTTNVYLVGQNQSIIKVGTNGIITELQNVQLSKKEPLLYPNPATNQLTVDNGLLKIGTFTILNTLGEIVFYKQNCNALETVDVSGFASGVYFVRVNELTLKMVKE
ncbi:MAG: YCF48-related protein [Bacteroidota bacterium]|jgi:photosystem II stability/assembly factor-like uncharacterized protein